jgi:hypothetical protein
MTTHLHPYFHSPKTSSWHGTKLITETTLPLLLSFHFITDNQPAYETSNIWFHLIKIDVTGQCASVNENIFVKTLSHCHSCRCVTSAEIPQYMKFIISCNMLGANFEAFKLVTFHVKVFWVVMPCGIVVRYQRFRDPCCLHFHFISPFRWRQH